MINDDRIILGVELFLSFSEHESMKTLTHEEYSESVDVLLLAALVERLSIACLACSTGFGPAGVSDKGA